MNKVRENNICNHSCQLIFMYKKDIDDLIQKLYNKTIILKNPSPSMNEINEFIKKNGVNNELYILIDNLIKKEKEILDNKPKLECISLKEYF